MYRNGIVTLCRTRVGVSGPPEATVEERDKPIVKECVRNSSNQLQKHDYLMMLLGIDAEIIGE